MLQFDCLSKTDGSAIYEGLVRHRRNLPRVHEFDFRFFMLFLDLDEIESRFGRGWIWSTRAWSLCRFRESDHLKAYLGNGAENPPSLRDRALLALKGHNVHEPVGAIKILTQLSYLGFTMNPVSFFYCYDQEGEKVVAIIAEVNNTPWGEQHLYVVPGSKLNAKPTIRSGDIKKDFHVSPFLDLNMNYRMAFSLPGDRLAVRIENRSLCSDPKKMAPAHSDSESGKSKTTEKIIEVTMSLKRKSMTTSALNWLLLKYPAISFKVFLGIYWNALLLYLKNIPFVPHPNKKNSNENDPANSLGDDALQAMGADRANENQNDPKATSADVDEQKVLVS